MTLLESYFITIESYAEQAKKKAGLDKDDKQTPQAKKIEETCESTKKELQKLYINMKNAGEKSEEINPIRNQMIKELNILKIQLEIDDGITFARYSEGEER